MHHAQSTTVARTTMSRRGFVSAAAAGAAGVAMLGLGQVARADEVSFDEEHDIVIIGAGAAGLSAALILQEQGADFVLLESEDNVMPSALLSGGAISLCETDLASGTRDTFYENLLDASDHECQEDLCRVYADNAPEMYLKLVSWGVEFKGVSQVPHQTEPFCHSVGGGANLIEPMFAALEKSGGQVLTGQRATHLVMDDKRAVVGVIAETADGEIAYAAKKGVILTCGDFTRNERFTKHFGTKHMPAMTPVSGQGCRGDGLIMGMYAGADTSYLCAGIAPTAAVGLNTGKPSWLWGRNRSVPCIGMSGKRFHRESDNYVDVLSAALELGDVFFQLYDATARENIGYAFENDPEYSGATIEELGAAVKADYPDFDVDSLMAEVERYNGFVDSGTDEDWGRTMTTTDGEALGKIETGPFYMMPFHIGTDHYAGGLRIDASDRVISVYGDVIDGLYAAGGVAGGLSSWSYMTGSCIGRALVQGMVAARTAVEA